jgi:hypothetical protein
MEFGKDMFDYLMWDKPKMELGICQGIIIILIQR